MAAEGRTLIGFYHICMINHYLEIVGDHLRKMENSRLIEAVKEIRIGCVGPLSELDRLQAFLKDYPKMKIEAHSPDLQKYEFITLGILKRESDIRAPFYGFYFHTKGVSYPGNTGGEYWRNYMNHYNLTRWEDAVKMLDFGYDMSGVKLINRCFPLHYSGNYFWFKSDYIKTLRPLYKMNLADRFSAEMWPCSGQPIAATLCQNYVDYNTTGTFKPE